MESPTFLYDRGWQMRHEPTLGGGEGSVELACGAPEWEAARRKRSHQFWKAAAPSSFGSASGIQH